MYKLKQGKYNSCMFISTWSSASWWLSLPVQKQLKIDMHMLFFRGISNVTTFEMLAFHRWQINYVKVVWKNP